MTTCLLSGPAMRTVLRIAKAWSLSERELRAFLGHPRPLVLHTWVKAAKARQPLKLPDPVLRRVILLLQIRQLIGDDPDDWLRSPCAALGGKIPIRQLVANPSTLDAIRDAARRSKA